MPMTPEEIRALYESEDPASDEEAAKTFAEMTTDPEAARPRSRSSTPWPAPIVSLGSCITAC
ncbi:MAG: hypothetical protein M3R24_20395 [Chloroflexota bacterium]|nr:hypothetical protein [Chloroflexota bacterium]